MAQVLEIPPMYPSPIPDGGANVPTTTLPGYLRRREGSGVIFDALANMYRNKAARRGAKGDCCPCGPYDQTPYREGRQPGDRPGLAQPDGPVRPFQQPTDPCDVTREKLGRMGITPEELDDCLRKRSTTRPRATKRRSSATKRRRKRNPAYTYRPGGGKTLGTLSRYRKSAAKNKSFVQGDSALAGNYSTADFYKMARSLGYDLASNTAKRKRKRKTASAKGQSRTVGQYRLLSNGACYNPRTRKFVKRANCR